MRRRRIAGRSRVRTATAFSHSSTNGLPTACASWRTIDDAASGGPDTSTDDDYARIVGRRQFVYTDARRAAVESDLEKDISDPAKLAAAKKDAEQEAADSVIELTADREYRSYIGDELVSTTAAHGSRAGRPLVRSSARLIDSSIASSAASRRCGSTATSS